VVSSSVHLLRLLHHRGAAAATPRPEAVQKQGETVRFFRLGFVIARRGVVASSDICLATHPQARHTQPRRSPRTSLEDHADFASGR